MTTYTIYDADGIEHASGIQSFERAMRIAQRIADDSGMVAFIDSSDGGSWDIDPEDA